MTSGHVLSTIDFRFNIEMHKNISNTIISFYEQSFSLDDYSACGLVPSDNMTNDY